MKYILPSALLLLFCLNGFAQDKSLPSESTELDKEFFDNLDTIKNKKGEVLKTVIVTTHKTPKPVTALRSGLKPMDVPQTIQVIGAEIIEQQQAIRLSEVLKNANGVYVGSARGGAQESFYSRGYDMSANNMFKNGFRYNAGSIPEVSGLEKVEFLKGGSALLFGNVAPGGLLNLVTKTPSFKSGGEISMQAGSYSYYKPSIDFYGPLNKFMAYRINGSYENSESFRDVVKNERIYINPSLLFNVTNKTQITLQGDYLSADWTPDFGTGAIGKEIAEVSRNSYFGTLWSNGQTKSTSASALVNHDFNKKLKLNFNSSFQSYDRQSFGTERIQPNDEKNEILFGDTNRPLGKNKNLEQIFGNQLSLQGCFKTGSIKHQFFTGADWENSLATAYTFTFAEKAISINNDGKYVANYYDMINLFSFDPATQRNDIPKNITNTQIVTTDTNRFGIYAQDLISFTEKIKLLAGIRWSWQESQADTNNLVKNTITEGAKRLDNAFSPKLGLVYQPTKDMSVFASYSNSFTPNTGTTVDLQPIKPSIIDQYEAGIKKDFWKGLLSTNITVYQITNSNLAQTAEFKADGTTINTDTTIKTLSGETKSKGIEIDVTARPIEGMNIIAGYSYNDMRYSKTTGANGSFIEGDRLVRTPANTANLSFFYTLQSGALKGISFGAIGNYIGDRLGGWNDNYDSTKPNGINDRDIPLEGYTTIDASVGYNWKKFSILCKLSNITNELNYTVHENYSINPIAPRQMMTSLKYKF
jgi:iron complex outermembrane receptor protein